MCGVLAWWRPPQTARFASFEAALALQRHRGPDAERTQRFDQLWLGHNRLSILDLSDRGSQPMSDASGRYTIVYNGEVYNYVELKRELQQLRPELRFATGTDTEVVLAAYAQWGNDAFARFNGMWALLIWDAAEQRLVVSRDRFGIKPLYSTRLAQGLAFASEIKPLLQLSERAPHHDRQAIARFFATGNVDGHAETWFAGIERFAAGTILTLDRDGRERRHCYWSLAATGGERFAPREEAFDDLLADAVRISLRSDVPVGVCLSGGIDSSSIACLASQTQHIESFTSRHRDLASDEFAWVEKVAHGRSIGLNEVWPGDHDLTADASNILWHLEEPAKATGVLSQWSVMRRARDKVTVLLDGQGGDEVFGGYEFHRWPYLKGLALAGNFGDARREAGAWSSDKTRAAAIASAMETVKRPLRRTLSRFRRGTLAAATPWTDAFLHEDLLVELERAETPTLTGDLHQRLAWDIRFEMLPALLRYEDKLSMAFSLESRVPLLDHRVVSFAFSLDPRDLIRDGWSKWPLRRVLARRGADEIAWRRDKQGFPTPMNLYWQERADDVLRWLTTGRLVEAGILDPGRVASFVCRDLASPHSRLVWHLVQAEWWFRNFIAGDFRKPLPWR